MPLEGTLVSGSYTAPQWIATEFGTGVRIYPQPVIGFPKDTPHINFGPQTIFEGPNGFSVLIYFRQLDVAQEHLDSGAIGVTNMVMSYGNEPFLDDGDPYVIGCDYGWGWKLTVSRNWQTRKLWGYEFFLWETGTGAGEAMGCEYDGGEIIGRIATPVVDIPYDEWICLAATYNGKRTNGGCRIYVNGKRVDNKNWSNRKLKNTPYRAHHNYPLRIGVYSQIDVQMAAAWSRVLTKKEITNIADDPFILFDT